MAFCRPTRRGRRCVPPKPGMMPSCSSGRPRRVPGVHTRALHAMATSHPPPSATPACASERPAAAGPLRFAQAPVWISRRLCGVMRARTRDGRHGGLGARLQHLAEGLVDVAVDAAAARLQQQQGSRVPRGRRAPPPRRSMQSPALPARTKHACLVLELLDVEARAEVVVGAHDHDGPDLGVRVRAPQVLEQRAQHCGRAAGNPMRSAAVSCCSPSWLITLPARAQRPPQQPARASERSAQIQH